MGCTWEKPTAFLIKKLNWQFDDGPNSGVRFDEQHNVPRCGVPPNTCFELGQKEVFSKVLRQIGRNAMNIHTPDINDLPPTNGLPRHRDPILSDEPVYQNMEVGISRLLEFENRDE